MALKELPPTWSLLYLILLVIVLVIGRSEALSYNMCQRKCKESCRLLYLKNYPANYQREHFIDCMGDCLDEGADTDEKNKDGKNNNNNNGGWLPYNPHYTNPSPYTPYRPYVTQRPPVPRVTYRPPYTYWPRYVTTKRPPIQRVTYYPPHVTQRPPTQRVTYPPYVTQRVTSNSPVRPSQFGCGLTRNFGGRIIGGTNTESCEFPWMVGLVLPDNFCGGTVLDQRHILTAAHCMRHTSGQIRQPSEVTVQYGSPQRSQMKTMTTSKIDVHPKYGLFERDYDVAIVTLASPLIFGPCVGPICLPAPGERAEDKQECVAAGWGVLDPNTSDRTQPETLKKVTLPITSRDRCNQMWNTQYRTMMSEYKICAGTEAGGKDACKGDSGGPLMCRTGNGPFTEFGIVSFGNGCALPGWPGIYTNVAHPEILQYIYSTIQNV